MTNKTHIIVRVVILASLAGLWAATTATGKTIYVDDNAVGANDGSSWTDAYNYLQDALADANSAEKPVEIRVAQGVYKPDQGANQTPGGRDATFQLIDGVPLKGGFAGYGESDPNARDIDLFETALSGDLLGNDIEVENPEDLFREPTRDENSRHVLTLPSNIIVATLDGFTVNGGNPHESGPFGTGGGLNTDGGLLGGLENADSSITVRNCSFSRNSAAFGGGVYIRGGSLTLIDCTFNNNWAGMLISDCNATLTNCTFSGNKGGENAGGLRIHGSNAVLTNCTFTNNSSHELGGGMLNDGDAILIRCIFTGNSSAFIGGGFLTTHRSNSTLINCTFAGNSAVYGGGMYNRYESIATLINCTFAENSARQGAGLYNDKWEFEPGGSSASLTNCIFWGGENEIYSEDESMLQITYSNVRGDWPGIGNIDVDPLFVDADGLDDIPGSEDDNLRLSPLSPCIDSGDPNYISEPNETDLNGNQRIVASRIDMGAYEFQGLVYVDIDAPGANNGSSWTDAYNFLQDALDDADSAETPDEIWVAQGVYTPDQGGGNTPGDRGAAFMNIRATFKLIDGVTLKGGFAGFGELDPNAWDVDLYETALSGDLLGNDIEVENPEDLLDEPTRAENSFHVVTSREDNPTAVLDGFTIVGGNANGSYDHSSAAGLDNGNLFGGGSSITVLNCTFTRNSAAGWGGGMCSRKSNPTLVNCTFTRNLAGQPGGGMYNQGSSPILVDCVFRDNFSRNSGGGMYNGEGSSTLTNCVFRDNFSRNSGGGMYNGGGSPTLNNCTFSGNSTVRLGGGMYNQGSSPTLTNCTFTRNLVGDCGGGMYNVGGSPTMSNCVFSGNSAANGGVMYNGLGSSSTMSNCVFSGNSADRGGVMYNRYGGNATLIHCTFASNSSHMGRGDAIGCHYATGDPPSNVELINCILWDSANEIWNSHNYSTINIAYSNVQGGWPGTGNIDTDPFFADPDGPDNIPGTEDDDLRLSPISPCVDAGDPNYVPRLNEIDFDGNPRMRYGRVDMGAYELQEGLIYVDDDAPEDPGPGDILVSDPLENGAEPHPMDSIQEAIDVAKDGYIVLVHGGVYGEPIDFKGKAIMVTSGSDAAVLEAPGDYAVSFYSAEGPESILKNFVIRNCVAGVFIPGSSPTIRNLTVVDNEYGITAYTWAEPDISNCIFWNNSEADLFQCEARYSYIEDGDQGQGNIISADPLFVDAENGDYHLKSEGWCWSTKTKSWTYDYVTSRCIDAGDPTSPLGDEPMSVPRDPNNIYGINLRINMGAYGGTCQASIPPHGWFGPEHETDPPMPNPAQWAPNGEPREVYGGGGTFDYRVEMTAAEAIDASGGPVEYYFECTTQHGFDSGWIATPTYTVQVGRSGQFHRFRVRARDQFGNETAWSELLSAE